MFLECFQKVIVSMYGFGNSTTTTMGVFSIQPPLVLVQESDKSFFFNNGRSISKFIDIVSQTLPFHVKGVHVAVQD